MSDFRWIVREGGRAGPRTPLSNFWQAPQSLDAADPQIPNLPLLSPASGTTFFQSISAVAVGVAALSDAITFGRAIPATAVGVASFSDSVTYGKAIAAVAAGVATLRKGIFVTISAVAVGIASFGTTFIPGGGVVAGALNLWGALRRRPRRRKRRVDHLIHY